jgi:hypothetical protein
MNKKRAFVFSLISWLLFIGLFVSVRFIGTGFQHFFIDSYSKVIIYWLIASLILATVFWLILILESIPKIRKQAYYKLILLKASLLLIAVLFFTSIVLISGIVRGASVDIAFNEYKSWLFSLSPY